MDSSLITLPAQYAVWIWAPVSLLTLACAAWLAWLLRDEPETVAVVAVRPAPVMAAPRMPRRRAATPRKLARAMRAARREQAQDRKRSRRPLTAPDYAYA
ncbi:hypothetical protein D0B54_20575 [Solimonas sp. K1W22B-7]|uniref:hypothetical protein n=1 Tax=Solimonas sp. K1W22B-7 TaxID=2303331 RepID=UPI000E337A22|nr:hypothetical protein [Solimonas sp. K1W22B-7]AXQ30928.1 hypothetical protein D0B54_20575 [Solimonas sp. K1W22B-7]